MLKCSHLHTSGDGGHSALECLINQMKGKIKTHFFLQLYTLLNYRKMTKEKAYNFYQKTF